MKIKKNVGKVDQVVRYGLSVVLLVVAIMLPLWWLVIPAILLAVTALFSFCGLYQLFGINTCKLENDQK